MACNECIELERRVTAAIELAGSYGMIDGGHHKQWVIDQMLRALLGPDGYQHWLDGINDTDGEYCDWDPGIPP